MKRCSKDGLGTDDYFISDYQASKDVEDDLIGNSKTIDEW